MTSKPSVSVVGSGRMAKALVAALTRCDVNPQYLVCRNREDGLKIIKNSGFQFLPLEDGIEIDSQLIFLAVTDDAISEVAQKLQPQKGSVLIHTSGAKGLEEMESFAKKGGHLASMHPIQTIPEHTDEHIFEESTCSILCEEEYFNQLEVLCRQMGGNPIRVTSEEKTRIHIAAVFISNYLVTLSYVAEQILDAENPKNAIPLNILKPLMNKTMLEIHSKGVNQALTGPVSRGDVGTIVNHLAVLKTLESDSIKNLYALLGIETAKLANTANRIDERAKITLEKLFSER